MKRRLLGCFLIAIASAVMASCGGSGKNASETSTGGTVPFDRAFIDAMVPHHEEAIAMAKAAKKAGLNQPDLVQIANNIAITQQLEIDDMSQWRKQWFASGRIDPDGAAELGLNEAEMGMQHAADFSGVADVDAAFASMMVDHHQGAVEMAQLALERAERPEIKELAESIIDGQEREIAVMEPHAGGMHHG